VPERGAVLIVVMLIMLTLLGLGVMTLWLTSANLQMGGAMNLRTQALYVAEAGLEHARQIMNAQTAPNLDQLLAGSNATVDDVPTGVDGDGYPNGVGAILVDGATPLRDISFPPASFNRSGGTVNNPVATTMGRYTVWIRNDLAEVRQARYTSDANQTVLIRARGVASDGRTNVVLEVTMVPTATVAATPSSSAGTPIETCIAGKNSCDDNSSTQYGVTFGN
jgi:Tfp pilus assembly protein PilX